MLSNLSQLLFGYVELIIYFYIMIKLEKLLPQLQRIMPLAKFEIGSNMGMNYLSIDFKEYRRLEATRCIRKIYNILLSKNIQTLYKDNMLDDILISCYHKNNLQIVFTLI